MQQTRDVQSVQAHFFGMNDQLYRLAEALELLIPLLVNTVFLLVAFVCKLVFLVVQAEVDRLEQLVQAEASRADYILDAAQDNIDAFAQTLEQQTQRHQRRRQSDLQRQRQVLARAAAEELVQERWQRMTTLKEVRSNLISGCIIF